VFGPRVRHVQRVVVVSVVRVTVVGIAGTTVVCVVSSVTTSEDRATWRCAVLSACRRGCRTGGAASSVVVVMVRVTLTAGAITAAAGVTSVVVAVETCAGLHPPNTIVPAVRATQVNHPKRDVVSIIF